MLQAIQIVNNGEPAAHENSRTSGIPGAFAPYTPFRSEDLLHNLLTLLTFSALSVVVR